MLGQIGHFQLRQELARGGQGVVYQAHDTRLGREVALKLLERVPSLKAWQRFENEIRSLARLVHPHIVRIHEAGQHQGHPYFVMDFVNGASLQQRLRTGPLPPREAAELLHKLARAVDYAHRQGVLHRDLKPDNVILDLEGEPRVADFGLAKATDLGTATPLSMTGRPLGTLGFCSPEQATGELARIDRPTDVYGLGATLYAALTGRPPINVSSLDEAVLATCREAIRPPSKLVQGIPRELEAICLRCLEKEPERRYPTAADLASALQDFLRKGEATLQPRARSGWGLLVAGLGVGALVLLGGIALEQSQTQPSEGVATEPQPEPAPAVPPPVVELPAEVEPEEVEPEEVEPEPDEGGPEESKPQGDDPKGHAFVQHLLDLLGAGNMERVQREVRAALAKDPKWLGALRGKLELMLYERAYGEVVTLADELLERDPSITHTRFNRAFALNELGRPQEAVLEYTRCMLEGFDEVNVLRNRAATYQRMQRPDLGLPDLDRLAELDPSAPRVQEFRGDNLTQLKRHAEAAEAYQKATERYPRRPQLWFKLGLARVGAHQVEAGIEAYSRTLELQPRHPWAHFNRGILYTHQEDFPKAIADLEQALNRVPHQEARADVERHLEELRTRHP